MRAVLQRATHATVEVDGQVFGRIGPGLLVLLGVAKGDSEADSRYMIERIMTLRIFADSQGKMNLSLKEAEGSALVVSQFTLVADIRRGRRPSFDAAAPPDIAQALYELVVTGLQSQGIKTESGRFGAHMLVSLQNDGPVTFILDSKDCAHE